MKTLPFKKDEIGRIFRKYRTFQIGDVLGNVDIPGFVEHCGVKLFTKIKRFHLMFSQNGDII